MPERAARLAELLRERLLWGLYVGIIRIGDRFPSVREIASRYDVDSRTALRACRSLAADGLLDMRHRSGMYVTVPACTEAAVQGAQRPIADLFLAGISAGIPPVQLAERLTSSLSRRRLRVACVGGTVHEAMAVAEMAARDFGVDSFALLGDALTGNAPNTCSARNALRSADASLTTVFFLPAIRQALEPLARPVFVATLEAVDRDEFCSRDEPLHLVLATRQWADRALAALDRTRAVHNLRLYVAGEDDLERIPRDVPVYVTAAAAPLISRAFANGRQVRDLRYTLDRGNARALIHTIVAASDDAA